MADTESPPKTSSSAGRESISPATAASLALSFLDASRMALPPKTVLLEATVGPESGTMSVSGETTVTLSGLVPRTLQTIFVKPV